MAIIIQNISKEPTETGPNLYQIRINYLPVTKFIHFREDKLSKCLELAAEAVKFMETKYEPKSS